MNFKRLQNYMDRLVGEYNVPGADCIVYKEHEQVFRYFKCQNTCNTTEIYNNSLRYY